MIHQDPFAPRLADLHTVLAADLDALLDLDTGLREVLLADHHTRLGAKVGNTIDVAAGLHAIVPTLDRPPAAATPNGFSAGPFDQSRGGVANLLRHLNTSTRLAMRHHPAITALSTLYVVYLTFTHARVLCRVDDRAFHLERDLAEVLSLANGLCGSNDAVDAALDHAHRLASILERHLAGAAREASWTLPMERDNEFVGRLRYSLSQAHEITVALTDRFVHDLGQPMAHHLTNAIDRDLAHVNTIEHFRARRLANDLDHARHDFTTADLRGIDLTHVRLDGLRWSAVTRWPSEDWRAQAVLDSTEIAPGLYEIRGGSTQVPSHT